MILVEEKNKKIKMGKNPTPHMWDIYIHKEKQFLERGGLGDIWNIFFIMLKV